MPKHLKPRRWPTNRDLLIWTIYENVCGIRDPVLETAEHAIIWFETTSPIKIHEQLYNNNLAFREHFFPHNHGQ